MIAWFFLGFVVSAASADELEKLLKRLDLKNLRAAQIENRLAAAGDAESLQQLRTTLAELYIGQLEDLIEKPIEFMRVVNRLDDLESRVPELQKPEMLFPRLETHFRHGEFLLQKFREDRREIKLLSDIRTNFTLLFQRFEQLEEQCEKRIETLDDVDGGIGSLANLKADREIEKLSDISFRSSFFAGWSAFHAGSSRQDAKLGEEMFIKSLGAFCRFLDVDSAEDVEDWDKDFLDLSSTRNSQALLGVALSFLALGKNADADHCFELLREPETAESVKSQIGFWQVQSLLEFGRENDAVELSKAYLESTDLLTPVQRGQIALLNIRYAYANSKPTETTSELGFLGFKVLAQLRQFKLAHRLIKEYSVTLPSPSFYTEWITGQGLYAEAEKSGAEPDYLTAAAKLQSAVSMDKDIPVADVEYCRYQLGWAYYKGSNFKRAAECFELVISRIARLDPKVAATASWLQHDCFLKQSESDPENVKRALAVLDNLVTRFPESDLTKRAQLQIVKLRQKKMKTDDTVNKLKEVVSTDPGDLLSQYELCLANYRKFRELVAKKENTDDVESELQKAIPILEKSSSKLSADQNFKLALMQLDIQIRKNINDAAKLNQLIRRAQSLASSVKNGSLQAEFQYRQFQIAKARKDDSSMRDHVQWLVENGDGTVFQRSVLVTRIQQLEQQLKRTAAGSARSGLIDQAIDVYAKLAKASGYNSHGIASNTNAKVAVTRLAELMEEKGDFNGAEQNFELLVKAFPKKVNYLKKYALLLTRAKKYSQAIPHWRKLVSGNKRLVSGQIPTDQLSCQD